MILVRLWSSIFHFVAAWGSSFRAIHQIFEKGGGWGLQMWEVGFWLPWQLWGTEASQSRKWLDLPCGRLDHPDNNPHSFEHPGSSTSAHRGLRSHSRAERLLVQVAKRWNLESDFTPTQENRTYERDWEYSMWVALLWTWLTFVECSSFTSLCHTEVPRDTSHFARCTTGSWSSSLFAKKYESSFKQTSYAGGRGTGDITVVYLFCGFVIYRKYIRHSSIYDPIRILLEHLNGGIF